MPRQPPLQRERWIDVYRGIGIALVVWGHVYGGYSFELIFLFHMPLFFFISGYLFRPVASPAAFCRRKAAQLLIPYAMFLLAIGIPLAISLYMKNPRDTAALLGFAGNLLLGGSRLSAWLAAFWFVTSFYAVLAIEAALVGRCSRATLLWLHAAMLALAYANAHLAPGLQVPFAVNVALAAAPIFHAGYLFGRMREPGRLYRPAATVAALGVVAVTVNHYAGWRLSLGYDMKVTQYGVPVLSFAAALACCVCMMRAARRIDASRPALARWLAELGRAAFVIMFMHMVFTMGLAALLGEQYRLLRVAAGLGGSWLLYRASLRWTWSRALLLGSAPDLAALGGHRRATRG
jgi:fucose 4-O-acetylase-like acetyltransferase